MHTKFLAGLVLLTALSRPAQCIRDAFNTLNLLRGRVDTLADLVYQEADEMTAVRVVARIPQAPAPAPVPAPNQSIAANLTGSDPSSIDQKQIDAAVSAACTGALASIKTVTNEAGFLGCYNIPFLNSNTRVFEADLRLYQISEPTGAFVSVKATDVSVQLSYPNAGFSIIPQNDAKSKRTYDLEQRQDGRRLTELQNFLFVGEISSSMSLTKLKDTDLMALVIPSIQLSADKEGDGSRVMTNLTSASMIFFVSGVFEGQSASGAAAAEPTAAAAAAAKAAQFSLPGTTLGIFPVGLIVTSVWALIFLGAVGYGTWGRIQFREQFRERKDRAAAAGKA